MVEIILENLTSRHSKCRPSIPERHSHEAYGMFRLQIKVAEVLGKDFHVLSDFIGGYPCIDLGGLDIGMTEHLRYRLDRYPFTKCHGGGEGVAGEVERQVLFDATDVGNFLQITVELLIGDYRHELAVVVATLIFVEDFQCRRKQRYHYFSVGLLAVGDYPKTTVEHLLDIIDAQVGEVDVCKPGEAGEDEDVTYLFQAFACKLLLHHLA